MNETMMPLVLTMKEAITAHATPDCRQCANVDECYIIETCDANAACEDTVDSFVCTCQSGYAMIDGATNATPGNCKNINECRALNKCSENATCDDTVGSYTCTCLNGWTGDGESCADIYL